MTEKKLHPSVLQFKEFVKNNPRLIQEVRKGKATWQELYEDWYLLGEDDKRWETVGMASEHTEKTNTEQKGDFIANIMGMVKKMDANQMQSHLNNLSQAVGALQGVLAQFQQNNNTHNRGTPQQKGPTNPFSFRQD
ncbi:YlbD family protein [Bacillus rubiinfantis]|uniref:YlbD family protein n=1 Tax=Bacillus rubiinfantis TaxID=1499680 RepID=UPI0005A88E79|nr:YlbD family protein [Bacillus rubiinfantis]